MTKQSFPLTVSQTLTKVSPSANFPVSDPEIEVPRLSAISWESGTFELPEKIFTLALFNGILVLDLKNGSSFLPSGFLLGSLFFSL